MLFLSRRGTGISECFSDLKSERIEILILKDKRGLGIFPNSGINRGQDYLQISSIIPGGPVDQDGRLKTGKRV